MLSIITINLNGIRSAARKGFFAWLHEQNADIICLQEVTFEETDKKQFLSDMKSLGYGHDKKCSAEDLYKNGFFGNYIFSKIAEKSSWAINLGKDPVNDEKRCAAALQTNDLVIINAHLDV